MLEYFCSIILICISYTKLAFLGLYCSVSYQIRWIVDAFQRSRSKCKTGIKFHPDKGKSTNSWAIVTGGTSGIGKCLAEKLIALHYNVIVGARYEHEHVSMTTDKYIFIHLDLSCMKSVKEFADFVIENDFDIHILINNAGVISPREATTREGFDMTVGVNYLGHALLTMLLLPKFMTFDHTVKIVNISSIVYLCGDLSPKKLFHKQRWHSPYTQYALSKLLLLMFTYKLHQHLKEELKCRNIICIALEPGAVRSDLYNTQTSISKLIFKIGKYLLQSPENAALTILQSISSVKEQGLHFYNQHGDKVKTKKSTYDENMQDYIWNQTMFALNLYV